ncbi:GntR family transcriptional regulator [Sporosarcina sp. ACRSL]|uniref:GntR family transcriptional regulator n=1 Tax=Sporosarcina sp. ACRSL TaxID=2918215 RepID=UPI001EF6B4A7|nr:GntR family transcriptional regulator [Sporosarcina sp. ACRSL]MCG7346491.1 GntR family transcriptional regulator [Sporosarcina sp. ACRSL]
MSGFVVKKTTLKEQVYDYLKNAIILGEIAPGERLIEEKISETLKVSRSPIREAVRMLEKDGLLDVNTTGGVTVANPTTDDFRNLYEIRVEMESLAAFYAAKRRHPDEVRELKSFIEEMKKEMGNNNFRGLLDVNFKFHELIVCASRNPLLVSMTLQLRGVNSFYRKVILAANPGYAKEALSDHMEIYEAIADQDSEKARELMRQHIEHDYEAFMRVAAEQGGC